MVKQKMVNIDIILDLPNSKLIILNGLILMTIKQKHDRDTNYCYLQGSASFIHNFKIRDNGNNTMIFI